MPFSLPTNIRVVLVCAIRRSCCLNRISTAPRYFSESSLAMQRARIEAAAALMSSGNSRNTKRTLPVSMYLERSIGNTFSPNAAQTEGNTLSRFSAVAVTSDHYLKTTGGFALTNSGNNYAINVSPSMNYIEWHDHILQGNRTFNTYTGSA